MSKTKYVNIRLTEKELRLVLMALTEYSCICSSEADIEINGEYSQDKKSPSYGIYRALDRLRDKIINKTNFRF